jgi:hypothetical protein
MDPGCAVANVYHCSEKGRTYGAGNLAGTAFSICIVVGGAVACANEVEVWVRRGRWLLAMRIAS